MSFQAKTLRVQLPSGQSVAFGQAGAARGTAEGALASDERFIQPVCLDEASFIQGSCLDDFTTAILLTSAPIAALDAEQLPRLREQLEARLKEVDAAEQALRERGATG